MFELCVSQKYVCTGPQMFKQCHIVCPKSVCISPQMFDLFVVQRCVCVSVLKCMNYVCPKFVCISPVCVSPQMVEIYVSKRCVCVQSSNVWTICFWKVYELVLKCLNYVCPKSVCASVLKCLKYVCPRGVCVFSPQMFKLCVSQKWVCISP